VKGKKKARKKERERESGGRERDAIRFLQHKSVFQTNTRKFIIEPAQTLK
jgi:hypothetical protein